MCSSTNLFPQWNIGFILVSLTLYTVGQVICHAVVERVWVHEDFVQLIQKPSLQTLFLFVFFDLESRWILHRGIEKNNYWGNERQTEGIFQVHNTVKVRYCLKGSFCIKYLFLDGHRHIRFDLAEGFHQELGLIGRLSQFLCFVNSKVMLLAKLK